MERNEAGSAGATADLGGLDAAFKQLEQRIERSGKKIEASLVRITGTLEAHLGRLETKLDIAGKQLAALAAQSEDAGNSLGRLVEGIGQLSGIKPIEGAGKIISVLPGESDDQKALLGFSKRAASQLLDGFKALERQIASLKSGGDQVAANDAIARIRREQELILAALKSKANAFQSLIDALKGIASNPGMSKHVAAIENYEKGLQTIQKVLKKIREFATDPALRELIDKSRPVPDRRPRQTGARETSPRDHQLAGLESPTFDDADAAGDSLLRLGGNAEVAAQGFAKLNEQGKRFEALGGPLATGLAESNALLGSQADRLRGLGGLLPELGRQLIDVFDSGTVGAERLDSAVRAVGDRFLDAFEGAIARGESLGDVLKGLGRDLANLALQEVKTGGIGGLFDILGGLFGSAKGNAFSRGRTLTAFARGGAFTNSIVNRPTLFPMASGAGLMGEAGPEAVLPLTRLANGELGVQTPAPAATVAGPVITYNIDARGADREGLSRLAAVVREQGATINYINRTLERRAVEAVVYTRGRGGNIARAFGGW